MVFVVALAGALFVLFKLHTWLQGARGSSWVGALAIVLAGLVYFIVYMLAGALAEGVWRGGGWVGRSLAILLGIAYCLVWFWRTP